MRRFAILMTMVVALIGLPRAFAVTYTTPEEEKESADELVRRKAEKRLATYVGKEFWIAPNPKAILRIEFYTSIGENQGASSFDREAGLFYPAEVTWFKVIDYVVIAKYLDSPSLDEHYLKIRFEDGKEGFLKMQSYSPTLYKGGERSDSDEYIYSENPANIDKRQAKRHAEAKAAAKARAARGGVRIGMTKNEVLHSNWGRPSEINRTITAGHIHEQWVYGGHNYLYFSNGILIGIQN